METDEPENDIWINLSPLFKEEEFAKPGEELKIPILLIINNAATGT